MPTLAELLARDPWGRPTTPLANSLSQPPAPPPQQQNFLAALQAAVSKDPSLGFTGALDTYLKRLNKYQADAQTYLDAGADPNAEGLQKAFYNVAGLGMKAVNPLLAIMPSSQELRDRAYESGASPEVQALGGALGDMINIPDPATSATALATIGKGVLTAKSLAAAAPVIAKSAAVAPLGRGLGSLLADATDAEKLALQQRLQAEAGQVGGAASNVSREQALQGLTSSASPSMDDLHSKLFKDSQGVTYGPDGKPFWTKNAYENELSRSRVTIAQNADKIAPLEASLKKALVSKDAQSAAKIREKINAIRGDSAAAQKRMDFLQSWRRGEAEPLPPQGLPKSQ